ncbi:sensory box protein [Hydrogenophaga sp. RAC07]|uniref:MHYT domain-containing protein n=1 Tax=Hydrogenophaga sp. RAC07 TaxID=1842537 RepID=UPI00083DB408|nr:MHYT domain-containing protein [Hydrogenophaga sp. RAC07]AOF83955.1 sensory box protein [Hydrogenophaga sp. RAC07]
MTDSLPLPDDVSLLLLGHHEPALVVLSVGLAVLAGVAAMVVSSQADRFRGVSALCMVLAGGLALGSGVWAMHFVGILALDLCRAAGYRVDITLLSMVPSVLASSLALWLLMLKRQSTTTLWLGGGLFGLGVGAMHYTGMFALEGMDGLHFDPVMVAVSVVVAVLLAVWALWVRQALQRWRPELSAAWRNALSGVLMGLAVSAMHYCGMAAVHFTGTPPSGDASQAGSPWLMAGIAVTVAAISLLVVLLSMVIRLRGLTARLQYMQSVVASSHDAIVTKTTEGVVLTWNQGATEIFGYSSDDMVGQPITRLFKPEDLHTEKDLLQRVLAGESVPNAEVVRLRKDGSEVHLSVTVSPIRDEAGRIVGASKLAQDISDRKAVADLQLARLQAEKVAEARRTFLANMSHEVRTPMNAILGFITVLLDGPLQPEQREQLQVVESSARSLLRLLNEILDTAKLDKGLVEFEICPFSVDALVRELTLVHGASAQAQGIELQVTVQPGVAPFFEGDGFRIRQVLGNLLGNAIKFTPCGHVKLDISSERGGLLFKVIDTGVGMPAAYLDQIFEPFSQVDSSTTRRFGGTGLGTTICKKLVDLMGGTITVVSELHQGSTFTVWLPLAVAHIEELVSPVLAREVALPRLNILIADDVLLNIEVLRLMLGKAHRVVCVGSGAQAVQATAEERFDVVLMDVQMPEVDGLEATRRIRLQERAAGQRPVPIIALTASAQNQDVVATAAAGMNGFVTKSSRLPVLLEEVSRVLALEQTEPAAVC